MTMEEKMALLEEMLEVDEGTLTADTKLADIEEWDSVAIISFIAMVDDEFNKMVKASEIKDFKTIEDALNVMEV